MRRRKNSADGETQGSMYQTYNYDAGAEPEEKPMEMISMIKPEHHPAALSLKNQLNMEEVSEC